MVISLVNPHDVLFYPSKTFNEAGYDDSWLEGNIQPPQTNEEDLSTKPTVQAEFLKIFNLTGKPETKAEKQAYLNYYGNLMRSSDSYLVNVLDKLEQNGLYDDTLIVRTADHGEMGLTHGGMRQKNFNFYEEATRVPLVYSNPKLFPKPAETDALVSHVDFLPTLASLAAAPKSARANWQGVDYSKLVLQPEERAGPGLRRLHLRRLPVRAEATALPETAEPHRQHPRRPLEAGEIPRRLQPAAQTQAAAVGDVRPEDGPARGDQPRLQRLRTHRGAGEAVPAPQTQARPGRKDPPEAAVAPAGSHGPSELHQLLHLGDRQLDAVREWGGRWYGRRGFRLGRLTSTEDGSGHRRLGVPRRLVRDRAAAPRLPGADDRARPRPRAGGAGRGRVPGRRRRSPLRSSPPTSATTTAGSEAVAGCDYVLHVASPFPPAQPKDPDELIVPAREGTLRVLRAALEAGVERVVITSSVAAVGGGVKSRAGAADRGRLDRPRQPAAARPTRARRRSPSGPPGTSPPRRARPRSWRSSTPARSSARR